MNPIPELFSLLSALGVVAVPGLFGPGPPTHRLRGSIPRPGTKFAVRGSLICDDGAETVHFPGGPVRSRVVTEERSLLEVEILSADGAGVTAARLALRRKTFRGTTETAGRIVEDRHESHPAAGLVWWLERQSDGTCRCRTLEPLDPARSAALERYADEGFDLLFGAAPLYPDEAISVGTTWTVEGEPLRAILGEAGEISGAIRGTFVGPAEHACRNCCELRFRGSVRVSDETDDFAGEGTTDIDLRILRSLHPGVDLLTSGTLTTRMTGFRETPAGPLPAETGGVCRLEISTAISLPAP